MSVVHSDGDLPERKVRAPKSEELLELLRSARSWLAESREAQSAAKSVAECGPVAKSADIQIPRCLRCGEGELTPGCWSVAYYTCGHSAPIDHEAI